MTTLCRCKKVIYNGGSTPLFSLPLSLSRLRTLAVSSVWPFKSWDQKCLRQWALIVSSYLLISPFKYLSSWCFSNRKVSLSRDCAHLQFPLFGRLQTKTKTAWGNGPLVSSYLLISLLKHFFAWRLFSWKVSLSLQIMYISSVLPLFGFYINWDQKCLRQWAIIVSSYLLISPLKNLFNLCFSNRKVSFFFYLSSD